MNRQWKIVKPSPPHPKTQHHKKDDGCPAVAPFCHPTSCSTASIDFVGGSTLHRMLGAMALSLVAIRYVTLALVNLSGSSEAYLVTSPFGIIPGAKSYSSPKLLGQLSNREAVEISKSVKDTNGLTQRLESELDNLQTNRGYSLIESRQRILRSRLNPTSGGSTTTSEAYALNRTFVGPSEVAGRGLFALEDVSEGEILTCYPGDALVVFSEQGAQVQWGDHVPDRLKNADNEINQEYMLRASSDDWGIVALPELDKNPMYLGHFANDGAFSPTNSAELSSYVIEANDICNAMHQDLLNCHMVTVATRNIRRGEEIFVTYGPEYWMEQDSFCDFLDEEPGSPSNMSNGRGFG